MSDEFRCAWERVFGIQIPQVTAWLPADVLVRRPRRGRRVSVAPAVVIGQALRRLPGVTVRPAPTPA